MKIKLRHNTLLLCLFMSSCVFEEPSSETAEVNKRVQQAQNRNLNVSILLDLSDRINPRKFPTLGVPIVQRDLGYIRSISEAFETHIRSNRINSTNDHIRVFFEPEPKNAQINNLAKEMQFSFTKQNISRESINKVVPAFQTASAKIYNLALNDQDFVGSDIWTFFKTKIKDYCIRPNHRNVLVVITDGYLLHIDNRLKEKNKTSYLTTNLIRENNLNKANYKELILKKQFGFIPANTGLNSLEVLVLGVNPEKGRDYEEDVIKQYWTDWFKAMGIKTYQIKSAELPNNIDPFIKKFIFPKSQ